MKAKQRWSCSLSKKNCFLGGWRTEEHNDNNEDDAIILPIAAWQRGIVQERYQQFHEHKQALRFFISHILQQYSGKSTILTESLNTSMGHQLALKSVRMPFIWATSEEVIVRCFATDLQLSGEPHAVPHKTVPAESVREYVRF